jgi:hypothetical protein
MKQYGFFEWPQRQDKKNAGYSLKISLSFQKDYFYLLPLCLGEMEMKHFIEH